METFEGQPRLPERAFDADLLELRRQAVHDEVILPLCDTAAELNDYQRQTLYNLRKDLAYDQTVDLPTRSGKSFLIRQMAGQAVNAGMRVAIVSNRRHINHEHATELTGSGVDFTDEDVTVPGVSLFTTQTIAVGSVDHEAVNDAYDIVFIDEGHRALGAKTVEGMNRLFPNAVRFTLTATPDYAENRSVTDEYGEKIVSKSLPEAIKDGLASPLRAFVFQTDGEIDNLDPNRLNYTPRELERLARFLARNKIIADSAEDLVKDGRQGLISTIPGGGLLHANILYDMINGRIITDAKGVERPIIAEVIAGGDAQLQEKLEQYELGEIDVLLFCDVISEGYTSKVASFFINGRPNTSVVMLTQQLGRIMEPKDREVIAIDLIDRSKGKKQRTVYTILEQDRSVQGVLFSAKTYGPGGESTGERDAYLNGLLRPGLVSLLQRVNNKLIHDLTYPPEEQLTPYEKMQQKHQNDREAELARETKKWEKILAKEGLIPDGPDGFVTTPHQRENNVGFYRNDDGQLMLDTMDYRLKDRQTDMWTEITDRRLFMFPAPMTNESVADAVETDPHRKHIISPEDIVLNGTRDLVAPILTGFLELDQRERNVLALRFGLVDGDPKTLAETGRIFDIGAERVRQNENKALTKLRGALGRSRMLDALEKLEANNGAHDDLSYEERQHYYGPDAMETLKREPPSKIFIADPTPDKTTPSSETIRRNKLQIKARDSIADQVQSLAESTSWLVGLRLLQFIEEKRGGNGSSVDFIRSHQELLRLRQDLSDDFVKLAIDIVRASYYSFQPGLHGGGDKSYIAKALYRHDHPSGAGRYKNMLEQLEDYIERTNPDQ